MIRSNDVWQKLKKVAVVTGASSGIGEAIAKKLSQQGASIVLVGRNEQRLNEITQQLNTPAKVVSADVTKIEHR